MPTASAAIDRTTPAATAQGRVGDLPPLTGLRFIAACSVAIAHGTVLTLKFSSDPYRVIYWLSNVSGFGMTLFFVLSGFVIHYNYRRTVTEDGYRGFFSFMWARFARLYPLFALIVLLDLLLGQSLSRYIAGSDDTFLGVLHGAAYFAVFLQSWFYKVINNSSLIYVTGNNASLTWSISTEWFFYCFYPVIVLVVMRLRSPRGCVLAALLISLLWAGLSRELNVNFSTINVWATANFGPVADYLTAVQDSFFRWLIYFSPYLRIGEFILGCVTAELFRILRDRPVSTGEKRRAPWLIAMALLGIALVFWAEYTKASDLGQWSGVFREVHATLNYAFGPFAALLIFCAVRYRTWLSGWLGRGWILALGEASYSIYLIHFLVFWGVAAFIVQELAPSPATIAYAAVRFAALLALVFLIALGLHAFIEAPARRWLRSLWVEHASVGRRSVALTVLATPLVLAWSLAVLPPAAAVEIALPPPTTGISVTVATYGGNCGTSPGNATTSLRHSCNGKDQCDYIVDVAQLRDPAPSCAKDFAADYTCAPDATLLHKGVPAEAGLGSRLRLTCPPEPEAPAATAVAETAPAAVPAEPEPTQGLRIDTATYGGSCGVKPGNATASLRHACNGKDKCDYIVDVVELRDPAPHCAKDFSADYACAPDRTLLHKGVPAEAGLGSRLRLTCPPEPEAPATTTAAEATPPAPTAEPEPTQGLRIETATYGASCGVKPGNATASLRHACNAKDKCDYIVDVVELHDPAPHCAKDFGVDYACAPDATMLHKSLPAEAGLGGRLRLTCPPEPEAPATTAAAEAASAPSPPPAEPEPSQGLRIEIATYGASCGVKPGNATASLRHACNGKDRCDYIVDVAELHDPAPHCAKDFGVDYACAPGATMLHKSLPAEAGLGGRLRLTCPPEAEAPATTTAAEAAPSPPPAEPEPTQGLRIETATYGASCGVKPGNATASLRHACNGKDRCDYIVDVVQLHDPAPKCAKDFRVDYACAPDVAVLHKGVPAEAGLGGYLRLSCPPEPEGPSTAAVAPPAAASAEPEPTQGLRIETATYGASCGVKPGNATASLRHACNGKDQCDYIVDVTELHDPAPKCGKDFSVDYACAPDTAVLHQQLPAEAGLLSHLLLSCPP